MFNLKETLTNIAHYLPHQAPLKDFVHHNTLSSFQDLHFEEATSRASRIFGYKTTLNITEYRQLYEQHRIREDILEHVIIRRKGREQADEWIHNLFHKSYDDAIQSRLGHFREWLKEAYHIDLDHEINSLLFKLLGGYLDQGIAQWHFPFDERGFLASIRNLEKYSLSDFVRTQRGQELLYDEALTIPDLLAILVGDESLYEHYLFEQQFSHPGWSGMVAVIEKHPNTLLDPRPISLSDLIHFELILEIDAIERRFKGNWKPLSQHKMPTIEPLFAPTPAGVRDEAIALWQEAFEWSYYDSVLAGIQKMHGKNHRKTDKTFQAIFCIDDREGSIRRHIENTDTRCETYGTPGHFGIPMYYKPHHSSYYTKVCPGPITPKHLVKESGDTPQLKKDVHFSSWSVHPVWSIPYSLLLGFWSGVSMFLNIFHPRASTLSTSSFSHMGQGTGLTAFHEGEFEDGLQVGFTLPEMATIVSNVLTSIGLVEDFGKLVYLLGHGASSVNNTHYTGYDCGACSGRPGSVNTRLFAIMANDPKVRTLLEEKGLIIPEATRFVGGLHDTTRDEFAFYDVELLPEAHQEAHAAHSRTFDTALAMNAKERSRRFFSIDSKQPADVVHRIVQNRSISLFEPRPELNHSTNALCIVGRHSLHEGLFLDRRAFSNSYDYTLDPEGVLLANILNAAVPVCGGINLEYFFSTVDNQKLGAGSKLPHNVVGLIGVSNGVGGDLRTGLPYQMIDIHDPVRLLMIVEHYPSVVLATIQKHPATYQWIANEWIQFVVVHPETYDAYRFRGDKFELYTPLKKLLDTVEDVDALVESSDRNFPVFLIKK